MRSFIIALFTLVATITATAQTTLQFQAHVPNTVTTSNVGFSAYIADSTFDENSHLNSSALWYVENTQISVYNGIINTTFENITDSIFRGRLGKVYVYSYVNGQSLGRLPIYGVPYSLYSKSSEFARVAQTATYASTAGSARRADTSNVSIRSFTSGLADSSIRSGRAAVASYAETAGTSNFATHAASSDTAAFAILAGQARRADTSTFAYAATQAYVASSVVPEGVVQSALEGSQLAPVGSVLTRGTSGISWVSTPENFTQSVSIVTVAPAVIPAGTRYLVSRVAVNYSIVAPVAPSSWSTYYCLQLL